MTNTKPTTDDIFDEGNAVANNWVKFTKKGDYIKGTLLSRRQVENKKADKPGTMQWIYEIKAAHGDFHMLNDLKEIVEPSVKIEEGEVYNVGGHYTFDPAMTKIKIGQIFAVRFEETKPSGTKGYAPMKIFKVYTNGTMDDAWLEEQRSGMSLEDEVRADNLPL